MMMIRAMQTVGIIGTGELGWRMGKLLLAAGHEVVGYDIRSEALERPKESGFTLAEDIADLCRRADFVLSCVTDGDALRAVVTGASGVAANLAAGKPLIDTTSAEPWITKGEVAPLLDQKGIPFLDAPVSGGIPAAETGRLNFMVGGDPALLNRCRPVLRQLGRIITHVGPIGSGHAIKAVNMLALAASMLSTAELIAIGVDAGLPIDDLVRRLDSSAGSSFSTRVHFPRFIVPRNYASGFSFDLMLKDLSIGIGLADRVGVPLFLERTTYEVYLAAATDLAGKDNTRIVERILSKARGLQKIDGKSDFFSKIEVLAAACNTLIGAETICLGVAAGLSAKTIIEVISESSGDSKALSHGLSAYLNNAGRAPALTQVLASAAPVVARALDAKIPTPLLSQMAEIHAAAIDRFGDNADSRMIIDLIAEWTKQGDALSMMWDSAGGNW
jgi:3-hydroxyisobutyrate dehydrogenase-like beta-hydroxyacid dehydrogenase